MNTLANNQYDAIERVIFDTGIRIDSLDFDLENDAMTVTLTSKAVLRFRLSAYTLLRGADRKKLEEYELIGGGLGIHWPSLDEDLSLKGFLEEELKLTIGAKTPYAMAA